MAIDSGVESEEEDTDDEYSEGSNSGSDDGGDSESEDLYGRKLSALANKVKAKSSTSQVHSSMWLPL